MTRNGTLLSGKLVLATIVATGMAAAPVALNSAFTPQPNAAIAQQDNGAAVERAEERMTPTPVNEADVYEILGTTRDEAERARPDVAITGTTSAGPLRYYQEAVMNDRLDAAAEILAAVSNRPITEELVLQVNDRLGLQTTLTAQQIAETAAAQQDLTAGADAVVTDETADNVYELLGTTRAQAEQADSPMTPTTSAGPLRGYQEAVENDRLDAAAENLAAVSKRPITEALVLDVNETLGIETRLTAEQIADVAARKQQAAN